MMITSASLSHAGRPRLAVRLAAFYAAMFLVIGIQLPFWPVWLAGRGLTVREIAIVFAAGLWAKVLATPPIGGAADRIGRRRVAVALVAVAALAYASLWPHAGFAALLGLTVLAGTAQSAALPLGDSITFAAVRREALNYGRVRLWGSISFVVAASGSGFLLSNGLGFLAADNRVLFLVLVGSALLLLACLALPREDRQEGRTSRTGGSVRRMAADPRFWLFIAAGAALQSSHQVYYAFGTLHWRALGYSDGVIGMLWGEAVVAEIVLFWHGAWLVDRLGPLGLMAIGGAAGIVRWSLTGVVTGLPTIAALQVLHALTFAASHLGAMHFLSRTVPPQANASAQALYSAASTGLGSGLVMLAAGTLYADYGGRAYLFMAVLSGLGLAGTVALGRSAPAQQPALAGGEYDADRQTQQ